MTKYLWNRTHAVEHIKYKKNTAFYIAYVNCVYLPKELRINPILTFHCCFYTKKYKDFPDGKSYFDSLVSLLLYKNGIKSLIQDAKTLLLLRHIFAILKMLVEIICSVYLLIVKLVIFNCKKLIKITKHINSNEI